MLITLALLVLAIPLGFLLAWMARDELVSGRAWFKIIIIASFLTGIWFYLTGQIFITYTTAFIIITTFVSLTKSHDKKWARRKA